MKKLLLFFISLGLDRLTKWWALNHVSLIPWTIFPGCDFVIHWNRGVSWSLFATNQACGFWVLIVCLIITITLFSVYTFIQAYNKQPIFFEMLVLGGAVSNFIDRFYYGNGAVLDFIELYVGSYHWPVFNIADAMIVLGIGGILLRTWRGND